jgi:hypothetical protein
VATPDLPPHRHEEPPSRRARLRRSLLQLAGATVIVAALALGAGWMFGRVDEPRAARLLLSDEVEAQEEAGDRPGPDAEVPTSGPNRADPECGVRDTPLSPEEQVATLASGVVVLQHDPQLPGPELRALRELVEGHDRVLLAPGREGQAAVVATAWRHRYDQDELSTERIETFVTGHRDRSPDPRPCPDPAP